MLGNAGSDTITVTGSTVDGRISSGSDDDTVNISGSTVGNIRLGGGDDTLNFTSSSVSGDIRGGGGTDTLNLPVGTVIEDDLFGTITVEDGVGYSVSSGTFTLPSGTTVTYAAFETGSGIPCFTRDTLITTLHGPVPIQTLRSGDLIPAMGQHPQPIRWIGRRHFDRAALQANPRLYPVRILAGALGGGLPARDLLVSRQHRMLVQSRIAQRMFGATEVLIPAIKLTALPGIYVDDSVQSVEYFHLLFDHHQVIFAEEAPTESLFTGPEALKSLGAASRHEIFGIFLNWPSLPMSPIPLVRSRATPAGAVGGAASQEQQTPVAEPADIGEKDYTAPVKISPQPS